MQDKVYYDSKFIEMIVMESNRCLFGLIISLFFLIFSFLLLFQYAVLKQGQRISIAEIKQGLLGVLILNCYVQLARLYNVLVVNAISRDSSEHITSNVHFAENNSLAETDQFSKIRPLFDHLNNFFCSQLSWRDTTPLIKSWRSILVAPATNNIFMVNPQSMGTNYV